MSTGGLSLSSHSKSNLLLLITAAIWGFAFVAQRVGMDHLGPYAFNGARFALGTLSLIPVYFLFRQLSREATASTAELFKYGSIAGLFLFAGSSFQQVGLQYTTAGNAGFITGLYIVFVPIAGLLFGQYARRETWLGAALALAGLYLLSINDGFQLAYGDGLELIGAVFWTAHVLYIGYCSPKVNPISLSMIQFGFCALLSTLVSLFIETTTMDNLLSATQPILYAGLLSVGVAYTLQVVAQRKAHPAHAAIILSLEAVFAVIGGWLLLNEALTSRMLAGCALMLVGMIIAQIKLFKIPDRAVDAAQGKIG